MDNRTEYMRAWREKNRERRRPHLAALARRRRAEKRKFVWDFKAKQGCPCGERDPVVLDLHHRNDDKHPKLKGLYGKSNSLSSTELSWKALKEELAKCDVLCANCHRRLHYSAPTASI